MKGLQTYFGVSDKRGEELISQVTRCWFLSLQDQSMTDVNMLKFTTAQNVKSLLEITDSNELLLLGILIEQAHQATRERPKKGFFGKIG